MILAHLSDLHFSNWDWNLSQFFSKRWLGNLNFLVGRRRIFSYERLNSLPELLMEKGVSHLLITGDLTTTSSPAEFKRAQDFVKAVEKRGIRVFCIPGNHDQYTQTAYRSQLFYDYFPSRWEEDSPFSLKDHGVATCRLSSEWRLVGLDTAVATAWFFSSGLFSEKIERHLLELLSSLPSSENVILFNHFPFFQHESPRKRLVRGEFLRSLLEKFPQVKIYCHGHTHRQCLADLRPSQLPIIFDSGSIVMHQGGSWHLLELLPQEVTAEVYGWNEDRWQSTRLENYGLV